MLICIENVLTKAEVAEYRARLDALVWRDGAETAGSLARHRKRNLQVDDGDAVARDLGDHLLARLQGRAEFVSAALPKRIFPPKFNRYQDGGTYGAHVDGAVMISPRDGVMLRSDLSATVFLAEADEYDGGELEIEGPFGVQTAKLAAGDMVLYPSTSLHRVTPVTRGARVASFFWIESLVADEGERALLYDLDQSIQALTPVVGPTDPQLLKLTYVYHNLLRRWAVT